MGAGWPLTATGHRLVTAVHDRLDEARKICCQAAELARANGQWAREALCLQTAVQFGFAAAADRLGALTANSRAQQLARQCGGATSPALHAAYIALPLTQREHEIVLLVAKGSSNRDDEG